MHSAGKCSYFDSEFDSLIQISRNQTFMESTPLNVVATTGGTEMETEIITNSEGRIIGLAAIGLSGRRFDDCSIILTLDNFLEQGGASQLRNIANGGLQDSDLRNQLVKICKLLTTYFDNRKSATREDKVDGGNDNLLETSSKYKDNPELANHFSNWHKARKELIEISKLTAERLDQQLFVVNIARIIGSLVEILNSLNLGFYHEICVCIETYANKISPNFGFIIKSALKLAPYLRFMGFASSFLDILESQVVITRVVNSIKNDEDMFEPLKEWLDETKELNDTVKRLFPYQINKKIIKSIEDAVKDLGEEQKIFSAAVLSNIMKDPMILKDKKFLTKAFRFCESDAAKGWYERMMVGACPSKLDCDLMNLHEELRKLEGADAEVASTVENSKGMVEKVENATKASVMSDFGRIAICMMSFMSIYWCIGNIRAGTKHRYSDRLRKLSRKAQSFLNIMEQIGF